MMSVAFVCTRSPMTTRGSSKAFPPMFASLPIRSRSIPEARTTHHGRGAHPHARRTLVHRLTPLSTAPVDSLASGRAPAWTLGSLSGRGAAVTRPARGHLDDGRRSASLPRRDHPRCGERVGGVARARRPLPACSPRRGHPLRIRWASIAGPWGRRGVRGTPSILTGSARTSTAASPNPRSRLITQP